MHADANLSTAYRIHHACWQMSDTVSGNSNQKYSSTTLQASKPYPKRANPTLSEQTLPKDSISF